jgi:hypothetical protein
MKKKIFSNTCFYIRYFHTQYVSIIFFHLFLYSYVSLGDLLMATMNKTFPLPDKIDGWEIAKEDQFYDKNNLYEYIDGGAELFLSYNFQKMYNRTYSKSEQPDIIIDIFDMNNSQNAFGVFSHSREIIDTTFGRGSQYTAGLLLFWKDKYYVSILASPETPESKKVVYQLARMIDNTIDKKGVLPAILHLLPGKNLIEESVRYFYHYIWMNSHYFIANKNILLINETTNALLAKYGIDKQKSILLLIEYETVTDAQKAYTNFINEYLPELSKEQIVKIEDNTFTAAKLNKNLLIIVFNAKDEQNASDLIESVQKNQK